MLLSLSILLCLWRTYAGEHHHVGCEKNCNVTSDRIVAGESDNITLIYNVTTTDFFTMQVHYNDNEKLLVTMLRTGVIKPNPDMHLNFISFNKTKSHQTSSGYYFSFEVLSLKRGMQNAKFISALTLGDGSSETLNKKLDILYQPKLLSKWAPEYTTEEFDDSNITIKLSGHPRPTVQAHVDGRWFNVTCSDVASPFTYTIQMKNISREFCGKTLQVEAVGFRRIITKSAKLNVVFTPSKPENLSYVRDNETCIHVQWKKIESGECRVNYTIMYQIIHDGNATDNTTDATKVTTNSTDFTTCLPLTNVSYEVSFRVRSRVGGLESNFSESLIVPIVPPTVPPTTTTFPTTSPITTTTMPTTTEVATSTKRTISVATTIPKLSTTASTPTVAAFPLTTIIVISVVCVVLLVAVAVIFILVRKGRLRCCKLRSKKRKDNNNNNDKIGGVTVQSVHLSAINEAMEPDYADVNNIRQQKQQQQQQRKQKQQKQQQQQKE